MKGDFEPELSWTVDEAKALYDAVDEQRKHIADLICYDSCTYSIFGMAHVPPNTFDLIIADPPFGIDFSGKEKNYNRKEKNVVTGYSDVDSKEYRSFTNAWVKLAVSTMKDTASAYIFSGWNHLDDILNAFKHSGLVLMNHCIWKYQFGVFTKNKYVSSHYHVIFYVKDVKKYFFNKQEKYPEDVWFDKKRYARGEVKNGTKLPVSLVSKILGYSSKPGDYVLDPFMGNGTTAVCAKGLYRHYFGYEINKEMRPIHEKAMSSTRLGAFWKK